MKRYIVDTTVTGAESMWDFAQEHHVVVRGLSKVKAEPTKFRYELRMDESTAILFKLTVCPLACTEYIP